MPRLLLLSTLAFTLFSQVACLQIAVDLTLRPDGGARYRSDLALSPKVVPVFRDLGLVGGGGEESLDAAFAPITPEAKARLAKAGVEVKEHQVVSGRKKFEAHSEVHLERLSAFPALRDLYGESYPHFALVQGEDSSSLRMVPGRKDALKAGAQPSQLGSDPQKAAKALPKLMGLMEEMASFSLQMRLTVPGTVQGFSPQNFGALTESTVTWSLDAGVIMGQVQAAEGQASPTDELESVEVRFLPNRQLPPAAYTR